MSHQIAMNPRHRRSVRPTLMALEERRLLSTFTVTKSADDGSEGTLRWATIQANAASEPTTILFDSSVTHIILQGDTAGENGLYLTNTNYAITIQGQTDMTNLILVEASGQSGTDHINHIFYIAPQVHATISNLWIDRGFDENPDDGGGGMLNYGSVSLTDCKFSNNVAFSGAALLNAGSASLTRCSFSGNTVVYGGFSNDVGGAIFNGYSAAKYYGPGTLSLTDCTISGNYANEFGGGLYNGKASKAYLSNCILGDNIASDGGGLFNMGQATLTNCTLSGNAVSGAGAGRGGGLYNSGTATLTNCTVSGNTGDDGGGLFNNGTATLTNCTVSGNAVSGGGGGLYNVVNGTATLSNSTISGNTAGGGGGGLYNEGSSVSLENCTVSGNKSTSGNGGGLLSSRGTATLKSSTISDNTAGQYGGGMYNQYYALTITDCTFFKNSAGSGYYGGGLYNSGSATLVYGTFSQNSAVYGGGIYNYHAGTLSMLNNLVAGNTASNQGSDAGPDVYATVTSPFGGNLIGVVDGGSTGWQFNDLTTGTRAHPLDPMLAPLGNYGGPTQTMALLPGSPALGNGISVAMFPTDQRGRSRSGHSDIGAFQSGGFTLTPVAGSTPQSTVVGKAFTHPLSVTVKAVNPIEPVDGGVVGFFTTVDPGPNATLSADTVIIVNGQAGVTAIANATRGAHQVGAYANGTGFAGFNLTNTEAPSLVVTTNGDAVDEFDGLTSLREATAYANNHPGPDTITFHPDVFGKRSRTIQLVGGALVLTDPATTTIHGPGARRLTIKGDGRSRVVDVQGGSLALSGLMITGGRANRGGGLRNDGGTLVVTGVIIRGNVARSFGGGLFNTGRARLTHVIVDGNHARDGGGIANFGTLALHRVTIRHNSARDSACGLFNSRAATLITR